MSEFKVSPLTAGNWTADEWNAAEAVVFDKRRTYKPYSLAAIYRDIAIGSQAELARVRVGYGVGDGSCDRCGVVPAIIMPTSLCNECADGVKRAEVAEAELATERANQERLMGEMQELRQQLFEMCKLCHKYQNQLWAADKALLAPKDTPTEPIQEK